MKITKVNGLKLLLAFIAINAFATSALARVAVSLSFAPPEREVFVAPGGYNNCYTVAPSIVNGVWINAHSVCEYGASYPESAWVAGYWGCVSYRPGTCLSWSWFPGHWAYRGGMEYGVVWSDGWRGGYYPPPPMPYHHHGWRHDEGWHDHGHHYYH